MVTGVQPALFFLFSGLRSLLRLFFCPGRLFLGPGRLFLNISRLFLCFGCLFLRCSRLFLYYWHRGIHNRLSFFFLRLSLHGVILHLFAFFKFTDKLLDTACCIDKFLFAGIKGMTDRANFHMQLSQS